MAMAHCDSKGRLTLRKSTRDTYGTRFFIVHAPKRIILIPVSSNPLRELSRLGKPLRKYSMKKLRQLIEEEALAEVG